MNSLLTLATEAHGGVDHWNELKTLKEHLPELEKQIRECRSEIALDLEEVSLVDVEAVRFLGTCAAQGVALLNCSPYITDWISRERDSGQ